MEKTSLLKLGSAIALAGVFMAASVRADQEVSFAYEMPVKVSLEVNSSDCDNSPGPFVTLEGEISLGGLQAQLIFQNNVKGTHRTTRTVSSPAVLIPAGGSITIPKQPVQGGVGGNPWIFIQFFNDSGNLSPEILLGRCVQGLTVEQSLLDTVLASTLVTASECSNSPGPWITFEGDLMLAGIKARIIFKNNLKGTHKNVQKVEVELVPEGTKVVIPKQPVRGGVGGNPWIWVQFLQEPGVPIGSPYFLGRCNQL